MALSHTEVSATWAKYFVYCVHGAQQSEGLSQGPLAQQVKCVESALSMCVHGRQLSSFLLSPGDGCVNIPSQIPSLATGSFGLRAADKQIVEKLQVLPVLSQSQETMIPQHRADSGNLHKPPNQLFYPSTASDWHFPQTCSLLQWMRKLDF